MNKLWSLHNWLAALKNVDGCFETEKQRHKREGKTLKQTIRKEKRGKFIR